MVITYYQNKPNSIISELLFIIFMVFMRPDPKVFKVIFVLLLYTYLYLYTYTSSIINKTKYKQTSLNPG